MHGNVLEYTLDMVTHGGTNDYANVTTLQVDPVGPPYAYNMPGAETGGEYCVGRGGSFQSNPVDCRAAKRFANYRWSSGVINGFRVACPAVIK